MPIPSIAAWQVSVPPLLFLDAMSVPFREVPVGPGRPSKDGGRYVDFSGW
jgi:hypothetical protein